MRMMRRKLSACRASCARASLPSPLSQAQVTAAQTGTVVALQDGDRVTQLDAPPEPVPPLGHSGRANPELSAASSTHPCPPHPSVAVPGGSLGGIALAGAREAPQEGLCDPLGLAKTVPHCPSTRLFRLVAPSC